jgi:hypothetical protein
LCQTGTLSGAIRIPDTVGQLVVTADLRAAKVTCHVDVDAPREGRATTRVNWLVRQLKNAPDATRVEAFVAHARGSQTAELLATVREDPSSLIVDPAKELRTFRVAAAANMGTKRGRGRGCFIDSVLAGVDSFYAEVLGSLRAWSAAPPKLRPVHPEPVDIDDSVSAALVSTDYSSQDEPPATSASLTTPSGSEWEVTGATSGAADDAAQTHGSAHRVPGMRDAVDDGSARLDSDTVPAPTSAVPPAGDMGVS